MRSQTPKTPKSAKAPTPSFGEVFSHSVIETVIHRAQVDELQFEIWDGHKAQISNSTRYGDREFVPGRIGSGMGRAIRFPPPSKPFGSSSKIAGIDARFPASSCPSRARGSRFARRLRSCHLVYRLPSGCAGAVFTRARGRSPTRTAVAGYIVPAASTPCRHRSSRVAFVT